MKTLFTTLRFALVPAAALLTVSCKNKDADSNPYASDPYYGPQSGGSTYGASGGSEYPDVQPTAPPAPTYDSGGYTAPPPAPAYSGGTASSGGASHTVVKGDTLFSLSRRYGTTVPALRSANGLSSDLIQIGQTLTIP